MKASIVPLLILAMSLTLPGCARTTPPTPAELHPTAATAQTTAGTRAGLRGTYFDQMNLTGPSTERVDPNVNFAWAGQAPAPGIAPSTYSARWEGRLTPRFSETYTFFLTSHDGARLSIGGQEIITQWKPGLSKGEARVTLTAGVPVDIKLEYFLQASRQSTLRLDWQSTSQPRETIPASQFTQPATPLRADPALGPVTLRVDGKTVPAGQPLPPIPAGEYKVAYAFDGETFKGALMLLPGETGGTIDASSTTVYALGSLAFTLRAQSDYQPKVIAALRAHPRLADAAAGLKQTGGLNDAAAEVLTDATQVSAATTGTPLQAQDAKIVRGPVNGRLKIWYSDDASSANAVRVTTILPYKMEVLMGSGDTPESFKTVGTLGSAFGYTGVGLIDAGIGYAQGRTVTIQLPSCKTVPLRATVARLRNDAGQLSFNSPGVTNTIMQLTNFAGGAGSFLEDLTKAGKLSPSQQTLIAGNLADMMNTGGMIPSFIQDARELAQNSGSDDAAYVTQVLGLARSLFQITFQLFQDAGIGEDITKKLADHSTAEEWLMKVIDKSSDKVKTGVGRLLYAYDMLAAADFFATMVDEHFNGGYYNDAIVKDGRPICLKPVISDFTVSSMKAVVGEKANGLVTFYNIGEPDSILSYVISAPGLELSRTGGDLPTQTAQDVTTSYTCEKPGEFVFPLTVTALFPAAANADESWEKEKSVDVGVTCTVPPGVFSVLENQAIEGMVGQTATGSVTFSNLGRPASTLPYVVHADPELRVTPASGVLTAGSSAALDFTTDCTAEGIFKYHLSVEDTATKEGRGIIVTVTCKLVTTRPHLVVPPVEAVVGGSWGTVQVLIENTGVERFYGGFTLGNDPGDLLRLDPNQHIPLNDLGSAVFGLGVDCRSYGTHTATLSFYGNADNTPMTVPVTIHCQ